MRPALRYPGGKHRLAPWIVRHLPPHDEYCEPFSGAASVLLAKPRSYREIWNDLDEEVYDYFRVLRDPDMAARLERRLRLTPYSRREYQRAFQRAADPVENARRLLIRSMMGYAIKALWQQSGFNSNEMGNSTDHAKCWASWPATLPLLTARLQGVILECRDAGQLITRLNRPEMLLYVDPPYLPSTRDGERRYRHEYTTAEHGELAALLRAHRGPVVLSGYPSDLYDRELYRDWQRVTKRAWASGQRRERTEVLWLNAAAVAGLAARTHGQVEIAAA